ncbi:hypothetical protein RUM43_006785 [Polyplax serrata]|uniref:Uncharacterized protein n=1 Tax=Polyplax serrata TaxID=468196 RepID=A0AAN8Q5C0_POLSC
MWNEAKGRVRTTANYEKQWKPSNFDPELSCRKSSREHAGIEQVNETGKYNVDGCHEAEARQGTVLLPWTREEVPGTGWGTTDCFNHGNVTLADAVERSGVGLQEVEFSGIHPCLEPLPWQRVNEFFLATQSHPLHFKTTVSDNSLLSQFTFIHLHLPVVLEIVATKRQHTIEASIVLEQSDLVKGILDEYSIIDFQRHDFYP